MKRLLFSLILFLFAIQPASASFGGGLYHDPNAVPEGFGGNDARCTGSTAQEVSGVGFRVKASRLGQSTDGSIIGSSYSVQTFGSYADYTVVLNLPYPPPDPANAWQCACNAHPIDPYQCVYTNQNPAISGSLNFFVEKANVQNNAWWQVRGGNVFSRQHVQSLIPVSFSQSPGYCNTTASCTAALIATEPEGSFDSPGFAFTTDGTIYTHLSGSSFIHDPDQRLSSDQAAIRTTDLPTEDYDFFYRKMANSVQALPSSQKPPTGIYRHSGNLTIGSANQWHLAANEQLIVFVAGNLIIDDYPGAENRLITVTPGGTGYLTFIVQGDIAVTPNVGYADIYTDTNQPDTANVEGVYIADGTITIQSQQTSPDRKFIGAGTFVGWGGVDLQRSFAQPEDNSANNTAPAETFIFRPDFLANTPKEMKTPHITIREIQPQLLEQ